MGKAALVIGASGMVGEQLVNQLLSHPDFDRVRTFVRRRSGNNDPKLEELVVDFDQPETWKDQIKGDVAFSTMGTTIKKAGTKENQYRIDFTYQFEFARHAAENGVPTFVLVSSLGANSKSAVFYSRMKGELDDAVVKLPFDKALIFRPSILDGNRKEKRLAEAFSLAVMRTITKFIFGNYRPTPADVLARKMISLSIDGTNGKRIVEGKEILI